MHRLRVPPPPCLTRHCLLPAPRPPLTAVLHLIAMARSCGLDLTLDDFQRVSDRVPFIADLKPSGKYVMEDVHKVGLYCTYFFSVAIKHCEWTGKYVMEDVPKVGLYYTHPMCGPLSGMHSEPVEIKGMEDARRAVESPSPHANPNPSAHVCCADWWHPRRAQVPAGAQPDRRLLPHRHRCDRAVVAALCCTVPCAAVWRAGRGRRGHMLYGGRACRNLKADRPQAVWLIMCAAVCFFLQARRSRRTWRPAPASRRASR